MLSGGDGNTASLQNTLQSIHLESTSDERVVVEAPSIDKTSAAADTKQRSKPTEPVVAGSPRATPTTATPQAIPAPIIEVNMFHFDDPVPSTSTRQTKATISVGAIDSSSYTSDAIDEDITSNTPTGGLSRGELVDKREAAVQDKVKEALDFKREVSFK